MLLCLVVCLTLLASFFLPSHLSVKHVHVLVCLYSCDSIEKLKRKCENSSLEKEIKETPKFKDFYQFTFNFAKNPGQKGLGEDHGSLCVTYSII